MDEVNVNLEEMLSECECHFTWDLEAYEELYSDPKLRVDEYIIRYNGIDPHRFIRRFRNSLFLSYIMYRDGLDGWDKMLENSLRIMEKSRNPDYAQALNKLPSYDTSLYSGSTQKFFEYVEDASALRDEDADKNSIPEETDQEERSTNEDGESSFNGLYVAAEHILYSLKATILFRVGSSSNEVYKLLKRVIHIDDMIESDKSALLFLKATTIRNVGDKGLDTAIDILKSSILTDPDNLRWPIKLIIYTGEKRRLKWGKPVDESEIQSLIQVIDSILQQDLEPWMRVRYQFDKFQALSELWTSLGDKRWGFEGSRLYQDCKELNETLMCSTDEPKILSYCAMFFSKNPKEITTAVELIEMALEKKPDCAYVNAKASNIYKKARQLDKALECAEKAATRAFGSCWQVFDLKRALNHTFDIKQFFSDTIEKYNQHEHVKVTHRNAALFYITQGDYGQAMPHFKTLLDTCDSDDDVFGENYCTFIGKKVHTAEAVYNVALHVLSSDNNDNERMGNIESWRGIKEMIEDEFDLDDFKYTGSVTPKQYIERLGQNQVQGVRDYHGKRGGNRFAILGTGNMRLQQSGNGLPRYGSQPEFGGRSRDTYMVRGSVGGHNRSSADSEPSNSYKQRFGTCHPVDNEDQNQFRNSGDSENRGTASYYQPPHQRQNRFSKRGEGTADSAENMASYFEKLEISDEKTHGCGKTRTTQAQATNMYSGDNRRNYKPEVRENWRSRADSSGQTRQDAVQSSSRMSAGVSRRNWRERDN